MSDWVLIVDDQPECVDLYTLLLHKRCPGVETISATDGETALALARERRPQLVVLDVKMPGMDGYEVCRRLKADPETRDIAVLMVSGVHITGRHRAEGLKRGADGYLCKPFEPQEFAALVQRLLSGKREADALRHQDRRLESELERRNGELRETEGLYRRLVESLPLMVLMVREGRIEFANPAAALRLAGGNVSALKGRRFAEVAGAAGEPAAPAPGPEPPALPVERWRALDGREIPVETYRAPIEYGGGSAEQVIGMDVTERLAAAEALRLKDEQLRQAQKMEALGRLTSGIAHDFNNLLTSILGYSHLLLQRPALDDAVRGDIEEIVRAGQRAEEMIGRLLAFSHSPSQSVEPVAINEVIEGVEKLLRRALGEDIELILDLDATIEPILADTGQLEEVLMNLAVNARDAMPAGGRLTIAAGRVELDDEFCRGRAGLKPGVYMRIEVADTGCGMTPEVRERVFEPFYTTKPYGKGTGLGLSIVYGIVRGCGGYIEVESSSGRGARFQMYFPRADASAPPAQMPEVVPDPGGTETILLVEDDDSVRRLSCRFLESLGYTVLEASNSGEALMIFERPGTKVDLVLTDIVMPHISGVEMAQRLRRRQPDVRVLFMTGFAREAETLPPAPHAPVLLKPFSRSTLARYVRLALAAAPPPA